MQKHFCGLLKKFRKLINALIIHASSVRWLIQQYLLKEKLPRRSFVQKLDAIYPSKMTHSPPQK